ncbi:uncharacterized protein LOC143579330 [Bidens hawaiensis]|uniref:uncharacterized protein LOC143579330 n=1 Tax=Bidens hawaiensis TaxID=980011 RepID=UPI00404A395B
MSPGQRGSAKDEVLDDFEGGLKEHYARRSDYQAEILETNPESTVNMTVETMPNGGIYFSGYYICFKAVKDGWINGCRKIICLDGCFLKNHGQLLSAVGRDTNNHIFPLAWAVVSVENKENWKWFLNLLWDDIEMECGLGLTLISDQHKGIIEAVKDVFPCAEHRQCTRHIYANFIKKFRGLQSKNLFWAVAKSTSKQWFEMHMEELKTSSKDFWVDNVGTMKLFQEIREQTCTCRSWRLLGIPCVHTVAALGFININPKTYVNNWFTKDMFKEAYRHHIKPLKGSMHWPKIDDINPLPPKERRMPGRPTVKRKRDPLEKEKKNKKIGQQEK